LRKHLSVFMLYTRSSIYRILILLILMAVAEITLFYLSANRVMTSNIIGLERMFDKSYIGLVMAAVFVLMSVQLSLMGCERGSKQSYTLCRLSVSEEAVFAWQALFNALAYFMLWAVQLLIVWAMCIYGTSKMGSLASNQNIFLAFYRNDFLHSLLPLAETSRLIRNILLIISLGLSSALFSYHNRRKKFGISIIFMILIGGLPFAGSVGNIETDVVQGLASVCVIIWSIYRVFVKEASLENEEI